jgi:hypothetical protein
METKTLGFDNPYNHNTTKNTMKQNKPLRSFLLIALLMGLYGCFEIVEVLMPDEVGAGNQFVVTMNAKTTDTDAEAKYGIVAIQMEEGFRVDSMKYTGTNGEGYFYYLDNDSTTKYGGDGGIKSGWNDSLASKFGLDDGFKWEVWEMEEPYSAEEETNEYEITIYLTATQTLGTYPFSFLITESSYELEPIEGEKTFDFRESQDEIQVVEGTPILEDRPDLPISVDLEQNYPNPFNPSTTITYSVPVDSPVRLQVTDLTGRVVRTLVDARQSAGTYRVNVDMLNLSSGVYLYRLEAAGQTLTRSMTLVK